jgi:hypothetical protein
VVGRLRQYEITFLFFPQNFVRAIKESRSKFYSFTGSGNPESKLIGYPERFFNKRIAPL